MTAIVLDLLLNSDAANKRVKGDGDHASYAALRSAAVDTEARWRPQPNRPRSPLARFAGRRTARRTASSDPNTWTRRLARVTAV